jgi:rhodanese-related sulfurtransferase
MANTRTAPFVLDVRTQEEWDEFHAPNTTFIPLDQLPARLNELPRPGDRIVCRTGNRSQQAAISCSTPASSR